MAEEAPPPALEGDAPKPPSSSFKDSNTQQIFKHWVKPNRQAYNYIYDYRRNYYDDVIDYLDRRQRGLVSDIPRAQTWAERALRTYTRKYTSTAAAESAVKDISLLSNIRTSGRLHLYHNKDLHLRKYRF